MRTILIIDDEKDIRKKYKKLLKKEGFKVIEAPNFVEVSEALMKKSSEIDLILLDINLPEVDGRGIDELIEEYAPNINVLVTSVHPVRDQKLKIPRAVGYFSKLDGEEALIKKVKKLVGV